MTERENRLDPSQNYFACDVPGCQERHLVKAGAKMKPKTPVKILQKPSPPPPKTSSSASSSTSTESVPNTTPKPPPEKSPEPLRSLTKSELKEAQSAAKAAAEKAFEQESAKILGLYGITKAGQNRKKPLTEYESYMAFLESGEAGKEYVGLPKHERYTLDPV